MSLDMIDDEAKEKSRMMKLERFPFAGPLPVDSDGNIDFYYGNWFRRSESCNPYYSLDYNAVRPPDVLNDFICDAIPKTYQIKKNIFPLIQLSKSGKSFLLRQMAVKYNRWVVLIDLASKNNDRLSCVDAHEFIRECVQMCKIRDAKLEKLQESKDESYNSRYAIHERCFDECQKASLYLFYAKLIHLLLYFEYNTTKSGQVQKHVSPQHYFDLSQNFWQLKYVGDIFNIIKKYDIEDVRQAISWNLRGNRTLHNNPPIVEIDECGNLMEKGKAFGLSSDFLPRKTMRQDKTSCIPNKPIFYPVAEATITLCSLGLCVIVAGTTLRVAKLIEGFASPYKAKDIVVARQIAPLAPNDVKTVIEDILQIKVSNKIAYWWQGRAGLLVSQLIKPFLIEAETRNLRTKKEWIAFFIEFALRDDILTSGARLITSWLDNGITLKTSIPLRGYPDEIEIGQVLTNIYHDIMFKGQEYESYHGKSEVLPHLVEKGLFFMKGYFAGKGYIGEIVEPLAIEALHLMFCKNNAQNDMLLRDLVRRYETCTGDAGAEFEKLVRYVVVRSDGKCLSDCELFSQYLKQNKNPKNLKEYVIEAKRCQQESDVREERLLEKLVNPDNYKLYLIADVISQNVALREKPKCKTKEEKRDCIEQIVQKSTDLVPKIATIMQSAQSQQKSIVLTIYDILRPFVKKFDPKYKAIFEECKKILLLTNDWSPDDVPLISTKPKHPSGEFDVVFRLRHPRTREIKIAICQLKNITKKGDSYRKRDIMSGISNLLFESSQIGNDTFESPLIWQERLHYENNPGKFIKLLIIADSDSKKELKLSKQSELAVKGLRANRKHETFCVLFWRDVVEESKAAHKWVIGLANERIKLKSINDDSKHNFESYTPPIERQDTIDQEKFYKETAEMLKELSKDKKKGRPKKNKDTSDDLSLV